MVLSVSNRTPLAARLLLALLLLLITGSGCSKRETTLVLGAGPHGGTFQVLATGLAELVTTNLPGIRVKAEPSGGSVANLFSVDKGERSLGLVFAGDAFLGSRGTLETGQPATGNVRALARLYGAAAHVAVLSESGIRTPRDLADRRVAIGSYGSGSALSAKRYFQALGIWEKVIPVHIGYDLGISGLNQQTVDAIWFQVGYPNDSILKLSRERPVRFLNLDDATAESNFYAAHPYCSPAVIPAHTYVGQETDIRTFQDAALLVANAQVNGEDVYRILKLLFSDKGMAWMRSVFPAARDLVTEKGLDGIKIPLHPGAERFWKENAPRLTKKSRGVPRL